MTTKWLRETSMNDRVRARLYRMFGWARAVGPYVAMAIVLPGGMLFAAALWRYRHREGKL